MAYQDHEDDGGSSHKISGNSCHCDAHYYWHHVDDRQKHFFKLMVGDFRQELTVPEKFANNFRGQISETVKVEAPDGNMYNVHVSKDLNKLVLRSGWSAFSNAYELKQGDLLVFRYNGDSCFKVLIFDPSGCEKQVFNIVMDTGCGAQQKHNPHEQSLSDEGLARHRTGESSHGRKASKMSPADSPSQRSTEDILPCSEGIQEPVNSGGLQTFTDWHYILATGCILTSLQTVKVDSLERKIRPEIPLYVINMNKTSQSEVLVIGKDYAEKYLPQEDQTITICHPPDFRKRDANLKVSTDSAYIVSPRWLGFFRDNELQEGDACAFEVSKSERRVTMTVHPLQGSYHPPELGASNPNAAVHRGYMVTKHTKLTPEQKAKVDEKLREIQSETPVLLSVKGRCDVSMCFSRDFAVEYLPRAAQPMRLQRPGMSCSWEAELQITKVHQLGRGWKQFVDDNALRHGDMCLFQLPRNEEHQLQLAMDVHIIRGD